MFGAGELGGLKGVSTNTELSKAYLLDLTMVEQIAIVYHLSSSFIFYL
jgi:hypothetical protein